MNKKSYPKIIKGEHKYYKMEKKYIYLHVTQSAVFEATPAPEPRHERAPPEIQLPEDAVQN